MASGVLDSIGFQKQKGTRGASFIYAKNTNGMATDAKPCGTVTATHKVLSYHLFFCSYLPS